MVCTPHTHTWYITRFRIHKHSHRAPKSIINYAFLFLYTVLFGNRNAMGNYRKKEARNIYKLNAWHWYDVIVGVCVCVGRFFQRSVILILWNLRTVLLYIHCDVSCYLICCWYDVLCKIAVHCVNLPENRKYAHYQNHNQCECENIHEKQPKNNIPELARSRTQTKTRLIYAWYISCVCVCVCVCRFIIVIRLRFTTNYGP